ncbi:hypothetical protein Tco_1023632 [Tanacetum coccineum]
MGVANNFTLVLSRSKLMVLHSKCTAQYCIPGITAQPDAQMKSAITFGCCEDAMMYKSISSGFQRNDQPLTDEDRTPFGCCNRHKGLRPYASCFQRKINSVGSWRNPILILVPLPDVVMVSQALKLRRVWPLTVLEGLNKICICAS